MDFIICAISSSLKLFFFYNLYFMSLAKLKIYRPNVPPLINSIFKNILD
jgi:hypothetical protein